MSGVPEQVIEANTKSHTEPFQLRQVPFTAIHGQADLCSSTLESDSNLVVRNTAGIR